MPSMRGEPSLDETRAAAALLFRNFCSQRFEEDGEFIAEDIQRVFNEALPSSVGGDGYANALMSSIGRDLRRIAEQVDKSIEREQIRRRASDVIIRDVTYDQFRQLLGELFRNGIDRTRIVVLFFFCTDLALTAYHSLPTEYWMRLLRWSLNYIFDNICEWVQQHGGWGVVLGTYVYKTVVTSVLVLVGISCAIYIKRNIWSSDN